MNTSTNSDSKAQWAWEIFKFAAGIGMTVYFTSQALSMLESALNPTKSTTSTTTTKQALAKRLKRPEVETYNFDDYEMRLLVDVLGADEIEVSFEDVGGLESQVNDIKDNVVMPIKMFHMPTLRGLTTCPTGVLLYGRPGTGKSLLAKAIAKESGCTFFNIKASSLADKYFGESDRLVAALFSLARKLGPSIVFIDEIETLLKKRGSFGASPALQSMQGVMMSEWDGLGALNNANAEKSGFELPNAPVVIMGATNRPGDLDAAFLRRMPVHIKTEMPDAQARLAILKTQLRKESLGDDVDLSQFAEITQDYSGSDLRELVRVAGLQRAKDVIQQLSSIDDKKASPPLTRSLNANDFLFAISKTQNSVKKTAQYNEEVYNEDFEEKYRSELKMLK